MSIRVCGATREKEATRAHRETAATMEAESVFGYLFLTIAVF